MCGLTRSRADDDKKDNRCIVACMLHYVHLVGPEPRDNSDLICHAYRFRRENLGSIRMKVRLTQERILPHHCYQSLVDVLVNAVCDPDSQDPTPLSLIEKLTPADQVTLAHQLVRLFIGRGLVIEFLDYMTLQEIRKSSKKAFPRSQRALRLWLS